MTELFDRLSANARERLQALATDAEDIDWPAAVARQQGWQVANQEYHARQRARGSIEMEALLSELSLNPPLETAAARAVMLSAAELYLNSASTAATAHDVDGAIQIEVCRCPLIERLADPQWHGLTACGCFARVRGWHDALGVDIDEDLLENRKWGDAVCRLVLYISAPAAAKGGDAVPIR